MPATHRFGPGVRESPEVFSLYFCLVDSLLVNDLDLAQGLIDELAAAPAHEPSPIAIKVYGSDMPAAEREMVERHFTFEDISCALGPMPAEAGAQAAAKLERACSMLEEMAPNTHAEMSEIVTSFVLANGTKGANGYSFDGVSSLEVWGLVLINASQKKTELELCETLAHESAHCTLFSMSPRVFFVRNTDEDRFSSPLRDDQRPLDGIYHATFVLARMHHAMSEMLASGKLDAAQVEEARRLVRRSAKDYVGGRETLDEHATFTDEGRAVLAATDEYKKDAGW